MKANALEVNRPTAVRRAARPWVWLAVVALYAITALDVVAAPQPATDHPRLWVRAADLPRLRAWAADPNNLVYQQGLNAIALRAKSDVKKRRVPQRDNGSTSYVLYPTESYAELFAFMSLIDPDPATRADYAKRAHKLFMYVINKAAKGADRRKRPAPFRSPEFSTRDRSRWWGEAFPLTADWIYSTFKPGEKTKIRKVFLRWINENLNARVTGDYDHPEPIGVVNDPILVQDPQHVRWSGNNYRCAHMRNIGLMSMALDPADDPGGTLGGFLSNAAGAWLYTFEYGSRHDFAGGLAPEGFEYSPQSLAYALQFLLALHTAGRDDPAVLGPQVSIDDNPFWNDMIAGMFHSNSPATHLAGPGTDIEGTSVYLPAWYGEGEKYWTPDSIDALGILGVYDQLTGNPTRLNAARWYELNVPPGGPGDLAGRVNDRDFLLHGPLYFLLFDPAAAPPEDPRPSLSTDFVSPSLNRFLVRTDWSADATWFTYKLSWNGIDHQNADGNQFEFYRKGEWLTKERTGYNLNVGGSNEHNTLCLQNDAPDTSEPSDYRYIEWQLGSQWTYVTAGDPTLVASRLAPDFVYALGDSTNLYNTTAEHASDVRHASRSIIWLKPDHIVVYDRAETATDGRFKRFFLNLPSQPVIANNRITTTTSSGQQLVVTSLLPTGATITAGVQPILNDSPLVAQNEPMTVALQVEAAGGPAITRFLHVLQGADAGAGADEATLVQSTAGTPFEGALVGSAVVLFPVALSTPFTSVTYTVPANTAGHWVTGLTPDGSYSVLLQSVAEGTQVTVTASGVSKADSGGVLAFGGM